MKEEIGDQRPSPIRFSPSSSSSSSSSSLVRLMRVGAILPFRPLLGLTLLLRLLFSYTSFGLTRCRARADESRRRACGQQIGRSALSTDEEDRGKTLRTDGCALRPRPTEVGVVLSPNHSSTNLSSANCQSHCCDLCRCSPEDL
ncbi:hypothetical protein FA10DRAFT_109425 [Acaromyces ingoldii]|uniref:Uncharacterized protein n=1 Tax=Acaromyces ingoldii TaxID=215250 RepID=A0A316YLP3_9BASI|nr:hypothetical protein FA10DRAFT_109425 [Acaromyces ingoldii]PWN90297.1 hypothetical protein FA10DRAFT_109425 [Acaromyces ingoldii]